MDVAQKNGLGSRICLDNCCLVSEELSQLSAAVMAASEHLRLKEVACPNMEKSQLLNIFLLYEVICTI